MFTCKKHPTYKGLRPPKVKGCHCRRKFVYEHWNDTAPYSNVSNIAKQLGISSRAVRKHAKILGLVSFPVGYQSREKPVHEQIEDDAKLRRARDDKNITNKKYKILLEDKERLEREMSAVLDINSHRGSLASIKLRKQNGRGEGIANALLSDYHLEERVLPREVEGLNEYNLEISAERLKEFFQAVLRFVELERASTQINQLVLWMLGDNVTGWLHEENIFSTLLSPVEATIEARARLSQGIRFLLENSSLELTIPCVVGNHGRITHKSNHATENGNSLEYMLYHFLANDFAKEKRVKFLIPESGFAFVDEFGYVIRGHHGHRIRYQGGVQGIGVPASKKIAQWNKTRHADLEVFGHHHTAQDGENFIANGSVIGFNAYAYKGGFSYQPPEQKFFVVHSKWGRRNLSRSIYFSK